MRTNHGFTITCTYHIGDHWILRCLVRAFCGRTHQILHIACTTACIWDLRQGYKIDPGCHMMAVHWLYWNSPLWSSSDANVLSKWHYHFMSHLSAFRNEPWHEISNNVVSATSEGSDAQSDRSHCLSLEYSMCIKLPTEHHLEFLSLKVGCTGSSESTHAKIPHCKKSRVTAQMWNWMVSWKKNPSYVWKFISRGHRSRGHL